MDMGRRRKLSAEPGEPAAKTSSEPGRPCRDFLRRIAGSLEHRWHASVLPAWAREALAVSEKAPSGTIDDVQHIVIFTQENR